MSATAFGSSSARAFFESPAHARDDPVDVGTPWAVSTWALAIIYQWGWPPFDLSILNSHSDARNKYLRQRRLLTTTSGETWSQIWTMNRTTGIVAASDPVFSSGWSGVDAGAACEILEATPTYMKLTGLNLDSEPIFTLELFNDSENTFELAAIRCAALLDQINLDEQPFASTTTIYYQDNPDLPGLGTVQIDVAERNIGSFPYESYHELKQSGPNSTGMAEYVFNQEDRPADPWPDLYFSLTIPELQHLVGNGDEMRMLKSKVLMRGEICVTSKRTLFSSADYLEPRIPTEEIVKCLPYAMAEPESSDGTRTVRFNPPCRRGFYFWNVDAWPKTYHVVEGELVPILDYPVACDLSGVTGTDPVCSSNPL